MLLRHELKDKRKSKYPRSQKTHSNYYTNYDTTKCSSFGKGRSEGGSYQASQDGHGWRKNNHGNRHRKRKFKNIRGRGYDYNSHNSERRSQGPGFRSKKGKRNQRRDIEMRSDWQEGKRVGENPSFGAYFDNSLPSQQSQEYVRKETSKTDEKVVNAEVNKKKFATMTNSSDTRNVKGREDFQRFDSLIPPQKNEIRLQQQLQQEDFFRSNTTKNFLDKEFKGINDGPVGMGTSMIRSNTISGQQALFNLGSLRRQETWKNQFRPVQIGFDGVDGNKFTHFGQGDPYLQTPATTYQQNSNLQFDSKFPEPGLAAKRGEAPVFDIVHQQAALNPSISIPTDNPMMRLGTLRSHNHEPRNRQMELARFNTLPTIPSEKTQCLDKGSSAQVKDLFQPSYQNLGIFLNDDAASKGQDIIESDYEDEDHSSLSQVSDNLNIEN